MHWIHDDLRYQGSVCISGLTAAGKTTHSHLLAGEFGLTYVSGSQIQLNFLGLSPVQTRDFWIGDEAKTLWEPDQFRRVDGELLRLEACKEGYIFDTSTMPWRHRRPALCIWLQSSIGSRVVKSIISHHGDSRFPPETYEERIAAKDAATIQLYRDLYGIEIGTDLEKFDLILDLSNLISEPSISASLRSIDAAHRVVHPAVGWYLTGATEFEQKFRDAIAGAPPNLVVRNRLFSSR